MTPSARRKNKPVRN